MPGQSYHIKQKEIVLWTAIWLGYCSFIVILSSLPGRTIDPYFLFPGQDKILHGLKYAGLAFCTDWCLRYHKKQVMRSQWLFVLGFVLLFAFHDEIQQSYIPGRTTSVWDVVANFAGCMVYLLAIRHSNIDELIDMRVIRWTRKFVDKKDI